MCCLHAMCCTLSVVVLAAGISYLSGMGSGNEVMQHQVAGKDESKPTLSGMGDEG